MNVKVENTENKNEVKLTFNVEAEKFVVQPYFMKMLLMS